MPAGVFNARNVRNSDGCETGTWRYFVSILKLYTESSLICAVGSAAGSTRGRPCGRITDCLDNLLDCVNHQLRFLGLNVVRALGRDFVFGVWCKCRQAHPALYATLCSVLRENRRAMAATG